MPENKIAIIIQARMSSNRLPGKVMMSLPLGNNQPMLGHIIDQLKKVSFPKDIFVATSSCSEDDVLEELCQTKNISCFRGSKEHVLSRFQQIAEQGNYDILIRYTGDNPIVDTDIIEKTLQEHIAQQADLTITTGLPLGIHAEIIHAKKLIDLKNENLSQEDIEHVTWFFKHNSTYKKVEVDFNCDPALRDIRISVDYPSDFLLASTIFSLREKYPNRSGLALIKSIYRDFPWIFSVNQNNIQKIPPTSLKEEIQQAAHILQELDLKRAAALMTQNLAE